MAINYGFFNSIGNDRTYNADDMSNYFEGLVSDGVYATVGDACIVKSLGGLTLSIGTGRAIINNKWVKIDSIQTVRIEPHSSLDRYDAICLQCDMDARMVRIVVVEGTPSTNPQVPARTNTSKIKELLLAHVYVKANADKLTQSNITDRRPYKIYCGWVTGLIEQVDTSELLLQFQTACEEKLKEIEAWQRQQTSEFETWLSEQKKTCEEWQKKQKSAFETWFNDLTESLTVNINPALSHTYEAETDENGRADLPFTYNDNQTVLVYINGIFATADKDYTIDNGSIQLVSNEFFSRNDVITFVVFKAEVVTGGTGGTSDDEEITISDIDNILSEVEGFND